MGTARRFEDLIAWKKARELSARIYQITEKGALSRDWRLRDQIRSAAVSIASNVAEGFERAKPTEFHQFLSVAKGSCGEVRSHLYLACDAGYLSEPEFREIMALAEHVAALVSALRTAVAQRRQ